MIYCAIVAGGKGTRMGANIPKQFLEICSKPILIRTIEKFTAIDKIDVIYVGIHPDWTEHCHELLKQYGINKDRVIIVKGGSDRNSTVFNIIDKIVSEHNITDDDVIITHDSVRPFVTEKIILDNIEMVKKHYACGTYIPAIDTVIHSTDGKTVTSVPLRNEMFQAQTPQSFNLKELIKTYDSLSKHELSCLTDTCSIFTVKGLDVNIVMGDSNNIKITTVKDLAIAETIAELETQLS